MKENDYKQKFNDDGFKKKAIFGISQKKRLKLLIGKQEFLNVSTSANKTIDSWKCSQYRINRCKATAHTRMVGKEIRYKVIFPHHKHK